MDRALTDWRRTYVLRARAVPFEKRIEIQSMYRRGGIGQHELAALLDINTSSINAVLRIRMGQAEVRRIIKKNRESERTNKPSYRTSPIGFDESFARVFLRAWE